VLHVFGLVDRETKSQTLEVYMVLTISQSSEQTTGVTQSTVSADGTVRTIFITPTVTPPDLAGSESSANGNTSSNDSGGLATGAVVGIVIGVIAAVLAVAGAIIFWFFRRRKQQKVNNGYDEPNSSQRGSSSGMIASTRNPEMVVTSDNQGSWSPNSASEQRRSRLMAVDPRMDPQGRPMFLRNKSHESVNTLHDDQDYSRKVAKPVLRATNPDPHDD
jgi:cell wall integrity and stress response component